MSGLILVYDGQCPLCALFSQRLRLIKAAGELELVDARGKHYLLSELKRRDIDLNEGMVLLLNDQIYQGEKAAQILSSMVVRYDFFNRCVYEIFSRPWLAFWCYPILKWMRMVVLALLWRRPIR